MTPSDGCSFPGTDVGACDDELVCVAAGCGNGVVEPRSNEVCDDGNRISLDGCSADCKSQETCGDGVSDPAVGEHCDCGSDVAGLPFGCTMVNTMEPGAQCRPDCTLGRCGDGVTDLHEACDDGNNTPGDGCRADCTGRWTRLPSNTLATINDVSAHTATDAWAVALYRLMRWDGVTWTTLPTPSWLGTRQYRRVYAAAQDEVFVVAQDPVGSTSVVYRYVGGVWTNVTPSGPARQWSAINGRGANIYVSGEDVPPTTTDDRIAAWNGSAFVDSGGFADSQLRSIAVLGDGTAFAADITGTPSAGGKVFRKLPGGNWAQLAGIDGNHVATGPAELFVFSTVGSASYSTNAGAQFTDLANSSELGANGTDVSATTGMAIAVGRGGAVLICRTATSECAVSDAGTNSHLWGVSVVDDKHAFIVGDNGTILF